MTIKHKQSLYLTADMLREVLHEAKRQDRPISWILRAAWSIARKQVAALPETMPRVPMADDVAQGE